MSAHQKYWGKIAIGCLMILGIMAFQPQLHLRRMFMSDLLYIIPPVYCIRAAYKSPIRIAYQHRWFAGLFQSLVFLLWFAQEPVGLSDPEPLLTEWMMFVVVYSFGYVGLTSAMWSPPVPCRTKPPGTPD